MNCLKYSLKSTPKPTQVKIGTYIWTQMSFFAKHPHEIFLFERISILRRKYDDLIYRFPFDK